MKNSSSKSAETLGLYRFIRFICLITELQNTRRYNLRRNKSEITGRDFNITLSIFDQTRSQKNLQRYKRLSTLFFNLI